MELRIIIKFQNWNVRSIIVKCILQTAMELMGIVGIIVNCALIGQSGQVHRMFPNITSTQTIILVVILEVGYDFSIYICNYRYFFLLVSANHAL